MNEIAERQQRRTIEDLLGGIRVEPARPAFIDQGDSLWHAYCLGFDAGVKGALKQIRAKVNGGA